MRSELRDADPPARLLRALANAPLLAEDEVDRHMADDELTQPELMVLRCYSVGMTTEMAAITLGKSYETVRNQAKTARYRLRAKNTTHAVALALRQGLIP